MENLQKLIVIEYEPPNLAADFEKAKLQVEAMLAKYDNIVITHDTLSNDKKLPTEINGIKNHIIQLRKDTVAKISEPIKAFERDMNVLSDLCETYRQAFIKQLDVFDDETKATVKTLLTELRQSLFEQHTVADEFKRAEFDDLVKASALTATGKLTKNVRDKLESRVLTDKMVQDQTERRLLELENQSLKAGLSAPLTRDHVEHFLFNNEETYQSEVARILAVEIQRQEETEKALLLKKQRDERIQNDILPEPEPAAEPEPEPEPVTKTIAPAAPRKPPPTNGKVPYKVTCLFDIEVPAALTQDAIAAELRKLLQFAGITTLTAIYIDSPEGQSYGR